MNNARELDIYVVFRYPITQQFDFVAIYHQNQTCGKDSKHMHLIFQVWIFLNQITKKCVEESVMIHSSKYNQKLN
jgi:hypothetical protein